MAKADDTSSTIDWIWLGKALALAAVPLRSSLAKEMLVHWIATGQLPRSYTLWKKRDREALAKSVERRQERESWGVFFPRSMSITPPPEYSPDDPRFWSA